MSSPTTDTFGVPHYGSYHNTVDYTLVSGRLVLPCSDGPPVTSLVHEPYSIKSQAAVGNKSGTPPLMPRDGASDVVLGKTVSLPLPTPIQTAGGATWQYTAATSIKTLESSPSSPESNYKYGRWPFRLEPMETIAEQQTPGSGDINLTTGDGQWNQHLAITGDFFTENM
jgi:hypothetical protein